MSRTCPNCNNTFDDNQNICPRCGMQYIAPPPQPMGGQQPYGGQYGQPQYRQPYQPAPEQPMSVGSWVGTILLTTCLGTISLILLFIWAFSGNTPIAKKNYCRGMLIVDAILIGVSLIFMIIIFAAIGSSGINLEEILKNYQTV